MMRYLSRAGFPLLFVAVLWIAGAVAFFVLRLAGTEMPPLVVPVGMSALGTAFLAAFFCLRYLAAERKPGKKRGDRHE